MNGKTTNSTLRNHPFRALCFGLIVVGSSLIAAPAGAADAERYLARMAEVLTLTADQRQAAEDLVAAHQARMAELGLDPETRREARVERFALMEEIKALLTREQRQLWTEKRSERRQRHARQRGRLQLMRVLDGVALSEDQRVAIKDLVEERRERGREDRLAFLESLEAILTPDQWTEVEALVERRSAMRRWRDG